MKDKRLREIEHIVWDWNGTLLNDISVCVFAMNKLLNDYNLPEISYEKYKQVFTFPVKDYYEKIGFDFNKVSFDVPALKFIDYYHEFLPKVSLFNEVNKVLRHLKKMGYKNYILSAMEQETLLSSVSDLGIASYFQFIVGISDHFAKGKVDAGKNLIEKSNIDPLKTLIIGDTLHDKEVAEALGFSCVLVSQGHQNEERLKINGNIVFANLNEVLEIL